MKILWCTNTVLADSRESSGNWMYTMLQSISKLHPEVEFSIFGIGNVSDIQEGNLWRFRQVVFPDYSLKEGGLLPEETVRNIRNYIDEVSPALIHIWGVEKFWGSLSLMLNDDYRILLEMQGSKNLCVEPFLGGLRERVFYRHIGLLEMVYPHAFPLIQRKKFLKDSFTEQKVIGQSSFINTQSQFVRNYVRRINENAKLFNTGIILRSEITGAPAWTEPIGRDRDTIQIFSVASAVPYKAVHITLRAFADLKKRVPNVHLKIAGIPVNANPYKNSVYIRYLLRLIKKLGISDSVSLPGMLNAEQIIEEYKRSTVFVVSSFIETYCLALAEALYVGVPCVASDIDALKEFQPEGEAGQELSLIHYKKGDAIDLSEKLEMVIKNDVLRKSLSMNSRRNAVQRNDDVAIAENQYQIYQTIVNE